MACPVSLEFFLIYSGFVFSNFASPSRRRRVVVYVFRRVVRCPLSVASSVVHSSVVVVLLALTGNAKLLIIQRGAYVYIYIYIYIINIYIINIYICI